jgi:hypothetical protein
MARPVIKEEHSVTNVTSELQRKYATGNRYNHQLTGIVLNETRSIQNHDIRHQKRPKD